MVLWGVIWGAIIATLTDRFEHDEAWLIGAIVGALAGWTLRRSVRKEIAKQPVATDVTAVPGEAVRKPAQPEQVMPPAVAAQWEEQAQDPSPAAELVQNLAAPIEEVEADAPATAAAMVATPDAARIATPVATTPVSPPKAPAPPLEPDLITKAVRAARDWLFGGNTIVRMGVLVLFVGLAFLAKFAIDNAMLPPEVRLAGIGAAGIALFVFGWKLHARQPERLAYALTLQGAGVGVLYLTVFAAFRLYQFLPSGAAFAVLALVCAFSTTIALLQNAMPMAFIGFAGAFAAPILVSTGQGSHVGLFSYYLLLSAAIATVAWLRAWRALNLLGFFATFGVTALWIWQKYQPEMLGTTEPFLVAFFVLYLAASLMYATRHGLLPKQAVDATLIFGLPLAAFGLQVALVHAVEYATAFSSLAMGAVYLGLGTWAIKRKDAGVGRWLAECFVALGMGFVTLAVPLALDAHWTTAVWAAEGAAVFWMGQRQDRWLARLAGMGLQIFAAVTYWGSFQQAQTSQWPLANPVFIGAVLLSASALAIAHWSRAVARLADVPPAKPFVAMENSLSPVFFWAGFLWWQFALGHEIERHTPTADGVWLPVFDSTLQMYLEMMNWLVSVWLAHRLALPTRLRPWSIAATPAWFSLPVMAAVAWVGMVGLHHVFESWGWMLWPLALGLHFATLKALDGMAPQRWWSWVHTGGVWLVVLLGGNVLLWAVQRAELQGTAWASVILLVSSVVVLMALTWRGLYDPHSTVRARWPLDRFALAYLWRAALPLAVAVALGALAVAIHSNGNARPLPYVPLLNPTDITVALALAACAQWLLRIRQSDLVVPNGVRHVRWTLLLSGIAFVAFNTVWLRVAHHWADVPWDAELLFASFLVQTGYSILWTLLAMALMLLAHRRHARPIWMGGAALLGVTVAKLFLVDLSNRGGSERIVAFIAVGVLMLVVGYFAPIPPAAAVAPVEPEKGLA